MSPRKRTLKQDALDFHKKLKGKISVSMKAPLSSKRDLSLAYTPGVGHAASAAAHSKKKARELTIKQNSIAVVSDGSAVLGLGNIGPEGALPVMEGKAVLFKKFADIDAFPIVLDTQDAEEIIRTVKHIAPGFGGINLEDISAPRCFDIERRLKEELDIPVMHDDQHGTAIVVLAGLINAARVTEKKLTEMRVVIRGAGAAGFAIAQLLHQYGVKDVAVSDRAGIIHRERTDLTHHKAELAEMTDTTDSSFDAAMEGADAVIGVSGEKGITKTQVRSMHEKPIVFALANPTPEIHPDDAKDAGAYVIATGRSDFPNQVNNALVFPGVFRGALDHRKTAITYAMKIRAAEALARVVKKPTRTKIIPPLFDKGVVKAVAKAMK